MKLFRISLARTLGIVLFLAVMFAALKSGSNDWFKLIYTITFGVLLYAAIAARFRGAFWYGFAVVGWAYFLVGFGPWIEGPSGGFRMQRVLNRNLVTAIIPEFVQGISKPPPMTKINAIMIWQNENANRDGVCHSALTTIFAVVGGYAARKMARGSKEGNSGSALH